MLAQLSFVFRFKTARIVVCFLKSRLAVLIFSKPMLLQVKVQRTLKWVLSQEEAEERTREAAAKRHPSGPPAREAGFGVGAVGSRAPSSGGGSRHSSGGKNWSLFLANFFIFSLTRLHIKG
jgi:hypothetical protein